MPYLRPLRPRDSAIRMRTAAYLRCHPYDIWRTGPHYWVMLQRAQDLALPAPDVYFDNGCLASGPLPRLRQLLGAIEAGQYDVVLLPGPFVLSLDDAKAQQIVLWMRRHGCQVDELPAPHPEPVPRARTGSPVPAAL